MADMLGKPYGGWTCRCCWDGSKFQGQNRKHDERQWQRDVVAGEHPEPVVPVVDDGRHAWGGLADYMNTSPEHRDPYSGGHYD